MGPESEKKKHILDPLHELNSFFYKSNLFLLAGGGPDADYSDRARRPPAGLGGRQILRYSHCIPVVHVQ